MQDCVQVEWTELRFEWTELVVDRIRLWTELLFAAVPQMLDLNYLFTGTPSIGAS